MKNTLKSLFAAAIFATTASVAVAESYEVNSIDGSVKISISLQGGGVAKVPGPGLQLPPGGIVKQQLLLNSDHTMTGSISYSNADGSLDLFRLSGSWYRPAGSKVIYYAIDGDPTQGESAAGTWGTLFDPTRAAIPDMNLQGFMPVLFSKKVSSITPIYPTVMLKTGIIKLKLAGDEIKSATTNMTITGRAMVSYCKMDKTAEPTCSISKGIKDASFGFSAITKSTVTPPDPT